MRWEGIRERGCGCGERAGQDDSPASVAERDVKRISLGGLAGLRNQAVGVESHRVLVDLWVMQEVPVVCVSTAGESEKVRRGHRTRCWA